MGLRSLDSRGRSRGRSPSREESLRRLFCRGEGRTKKRSARFFPSGGSWLPPRPVDSAAEIAADALDDILLSPLDFETSEGTVHLLSPLELAIVAARPDCSVLVRQRAVALYTTKKFVYDSPGKSRPRKSECAPFPLPSAAPDGLTPPSPDS